MRTAEFHRLAVTVLSMLAGLSGCASLDPRADHRRVADLVAQRTGVQGTYDPAEEAAIEGRVAGLLADGLTVEEAVQIALLNNREFQALFQTIGASRADVAQSQLLTNPSLAMSLRFPDGGGRSNLTLGFGQEIVDLWQIPVRRKIAESELEQTVLNVARRGVEIAAEVRVKCYELLAIERAEAIGRESVALNERTLEQAKARLEAGQIGQTDVSLARSDVLNARIELVKLARDRRVARAALADAMDVSRLSGPWTLRDALPEPLASVPDDAELIARATAERLDVRAAAVAVETAEGELAQAQLNLFPSITVGVDSERMEARAAPGRTVLADTARESIAAGRLTAPGIQSRAERDADRRGQIDWKLGPTLEMTMPVWDQNQAQIAKARWKVAQARKEHENLLDTVVREVRQASAVARAAEEMTRFYTKEILPEARKSVELTRQAYRAGQQDILALLLAERTLIEQERAYVDALRDYAVARADLERALGGRLPAGPATQPTATRPVSSGQPATACAQVGRTAE